MALTDHSLTIYSGDVSGSCIMQAGKHNSRICATQLLRIRKF